MGFQLFLCVKDMAGTGRFPTITILKNAWTPDKRLYVCIFHNTPFQIPLEKYIFLWRNFRRGRHNYKLMPGTPSVVRRVYMEVRIFYKTAPFVKRFPAIGNRIKRRIDFKDDDFPLLLQKL